MSELILAIGNHKELTRYIPKAIIGLFNEMKFSFTSEHVREFSEIAPRIQDVKELSNFINNSILEHLPECNDDELVEIMSKLGIFGEPTKEEYNGHLDVVQYLTQECHRDVEAKDKDGRTPLHYASENGRLNVVQYLAKECKGSSRQLFVPPEIVLSKGHANLCDYGEVCKSSISCDLDRCDEICDLEKEEFLENDDDVCDLEKEESLEKDDDENENEKGEEKESESEYEDDYEQKSDNDDDIMDMWN